MAPADLFHGTPEQEHGVRRLHAPERMEGELDLTRTPLVLGGAEGQPDVDEVLAQNLEDRIDLIVMPLVQVLIPVSDGAHLRRFRRTFPGHPAGRAAASRPPAW